MIVEFADANDGLERFKGHLQSGAICSRARIWHHDSGVVSNQIIPADFWFEDAFELLDWDLGDFEEPSDTPVAIDIRFDCRALLEIIPVALRGAAVRSISVLGDDEWLSANEAISLIAPMMLRPARHAESRIWAAAQSGLIASRAVEMRASNSGFAGWKLIEREWDVPGWFWEGFADPQSSSRDFEMGRLRGKARNPLRYSYVELNGVHFQREDLIACFNVQPIVAIKQNETAAKPAKKGGRPPAEFWDDMWAAIAVQLFDGTLQPKTQADIERAMSDWIASKGHDAGNTTVRARARRLWDAIGSSDD